MIWYAPGSPLVLVGSAAREASVDAGARVALRTSQAQLRRATGAPLAIWLLGAAGAPATGAGAQGASWGEPAASEAGVRLAWLPKAAWGAPQGTAAGEPGVVLTLHTPAEADTRVRALPLGDERAGRALLSAAAKAVHEELGLGARLREEATSRQLDDIVRLAAQLPTDRWRAQAWADATGRAVPDFDAPAGPIAEGLRAWASASASLVFAGLGRIASADSALGAAVARRMVLLAFVPVDDETTVLAPVWSTQQAQLLQSVLAAGATSQQAQTGAHTWLSAQPQLLLWAIEHAGAREGVGLSHRGALAVLSMESRGLAGATGAGLTIEPAAIRALHGASLVAKVTGEGARPVGVRVADQQATCALHGGLAGAQPPGAPLPPLQADWTLADATAGRARELSGVGALITQVPDARGGAARWALVVQVERRAEGAAIDELRVWLGRTGTGARSVVATPDGGAIDARTRAGVPAHVHAGAERWTLTLVLDDRDVARDEVHVAIQARATRTGERWSTPLAQMPWQARPSPWSIDLSTWDQGLTVPRRTGVP